MKQIKIPHTFTIVFFLILVAAACSWVIPGGSFERTTIDVVADDGSTTSREVVLNDSFQYIEHVPQTWQIFSALYNGFCDKADIIVFILMVGGAFWILNESKAIDVGVMTFLRRVKQLNNIKLFKKLNVESLIIVLTMLLFSLFGAVFGMSEETIAFVAIFIPLSISMGYDSIVGLCMCYVAAHVGFAGAMLNPFTIGIAQGIAGLPIFSGIEYRLVCWVVFTVVAITFVLIYAAKVKRNPQSSPVYKLDSYWRSRSEEQSLDTDMRATSVSAWVVYVLISVVAVVVAFRYPFTEISIGSQLWSVCLLPIIAVLFVVCGFIALRKRVHYFIMLVLLFTIAYLIVGVLGYGWYVEEISALFLAMGLLCGAAYGLSADSLAKSFLAGCKDILSAALVVGLASGIIFILNDGKVMDTILYGLTRSLSDTGEVASVGIMYAFQTLLNIIMPSGSAKAALTMPIMSQFADLIDVSRQTTVLAFQFGDGITNMITPTSGVLIGCLGVAKIPYGTWLKWAWKFIILLIILGFVMLLPTLAWSLPGF